MKPKGFTLIELMMVVAIIGIIAAIAYPSFSDSMMKARRSDARSALLEIAIQQAKLRGSCATYGSSLADDNDCDRKEVKGSDKSHEGYYSIAVSNATGNAYTLTATAQGVQAKDTGCTSLTVTFNASNPKGLKAPAACW
ncbi:type IV pilin protein [Thalassotalea crassostreae]|uniref:type IV pilin protein n=1 Tax=Thalassotalea crassostreae TaxID=1763536 RepID=UPI0039F61078